jgi:hypothetical protein
MNARAERTLNRRRAGVLAALAVVGLATLVLIAGLLPRGDTDVTRLQAAPFGDATVEAAVDILARVGVATYDGPEATEPLVEVTGPASPLALLRDQVRAMALEANAGGGIPGEEIDALIDVEEDLAPPSYILAGYVVEAETDGAEFARALMDEQEWSQAPKVVFPQLVLALFTADVVRERQAAAEADDGADPSVVLLAGPRVVGQAAAMADPGGLDRVQLAAAPSSGPCSAVTNFINNVLKFVFDSLKLGESGGIGGFFAKIWNFVVTALETVVTALIKAVTKPVLDLIAKVAAVVAMVSVVISALRPWVASIHADPAVTEKGTNSRPPDHGALVAKVDSGGMVEWPAWAEDCARVADQPLPSLKPEGAPVSWEPVQQIPPALISEDAAEPQLDSQSQARLEYTTLIDPVDDPYDTYSGWIAVSATIERPAIKQLASIAESQLLGLLPGFIADAIYAPLLKPSVDRIISRLSRLLTVTASGPATVLYHVQRDPTPSPPTPPPTPRPAPPSAPRPVPPGGGGIGGGPAGGGDGGCASTCPGSNGDPHLVTVDGYSYDFQAAGEFTLLRSGDGTFEIQARQEPYKSYGTVSINTAVAVGLAGDRVGVYTEGSDLRVLINGGEISPTTAANAGALEVRWVADGVEVLAPDSTLIWILGQAEWGLNVVIDSSEELETSGMGLLGPMEGELLPRLPDGSLLDASADFRDVLYGLFAEAWAVTEANTLFDYQAGAGPATYRDRSFPDPNAPLDFNDLTSEQRQIGLAACAAVENVALREQCAFDVVITGDASFADAYASTDELHARRGGDACRILSDEQILALTGLSVANRSPGTEGPGNSGCTWHLETGTDLIDPDTGELATWDIELGLLSPGGRAAFQEELVVFEALGYEDVAGLDDRVMVGASWEPIIAVKGDTLIAIMYIDPLSEADPKQTLIEIMRAVLDRV